MKQPAKVPSANRVVEVILMVLAIADRAEAQQKKGA
jgi:hypothetical protein